MRFAVVIVPGVQGNIRQVLRRPEPEDLERILKEIPGAKLAERPKTAKDWEEVGPEEVLLRWPRLVAHLICESLGYFTPLSAALAILEYKRNAPYFCEWYDYMASLHAKYEFQRTRKRFTAQEYDDLVRKIGLDVLKNAIRSRHQHRGYMADYENGLAAVRAELEGHGPIFASWF